MGRFLAVLLLALAPLPALASVPVRWVELAPMPDATGEVRCGVVGVRGGGGR